MSNEFWGYFFGFLGLVTVSIIGHVVTYLNSKRLQSDLIVVKDNVQKIETATNSMKDALVKATGEANKAEGILQGRADERADGNRA